VITGIRPSLVRHTSIFPFGLPILPFPLQEFCGNESRLVATDTEHAEDDVYDETAGEKTGDKGSDLFFYLI
jgi:hypothetical protein